jgi:hypothetical protein
VTPSDIANAQKFKGLVTARVPVVTEHGCGGGDRRQNGEGECNPDPFPPADAPHPAQDRRFANAKP